MRIDKSCGLRILERIRTANVLPHVEGRLLDIGCGYNNLVRNYNGEGIGVDVFAWGEADLLVKDTARMDFADETFDTITFVGCLNHIPNRTEVLKEAHRLLKAGGKLIITMIPYWIGSVWHRRFERFWGEQRRGRRFRKGEVGGIDPDEVIRLLRKAGFSLRRREQFMFGFNNLFIAEKLSSPDTCPQ